MHLRVLEGWVTLSVCSKVWFYYMTRWYLLVFFLYFAASFPLAYELVCLNGEKHKAELRGAGRAWGRVGRHCLYLDRQLALDGDSSNDSFVHIAIWLLHLPDRQGAVRIAVVGLQGIR